jgi:hypothetical protein
MIGKKINQLATELAPVSTDLTIIGDPTTGVSKKITLAQLGAIFSGAVSFYTNLAGFPAVGDINVIYCAKDTQKLYLWSGSAYVEVFPSQALLDTYQLRSEKGNANGYASLDSQGKVPISQLPSSIMEYKGTWNAATNTPTLANGTGDTGDVYICNVAGTVNFGAGPLTFAVGDYVIYSGSIWQRSSGAVGTVTSVAATITGDSLTISGSPVTTSGTLAFAFNGTTAQYIRGNGTLETFPTSLISGTGNVNAIPKFTANTVLGNSSMEDDGSFVSMRGLKLNLIAGTGNSINFQQASGIIAAGLGYSSIGAAGSTGIKFYLDQNSTTRSFVLDTTTITSDTERTYSMPNSSGTLALTSQIPSLTGYVPYTGATANLDLGTHTLIAAKGTFSSSGSGDTVGITHSSGSGIALNITKGGSGEGLYINKTSGSGNAATIIGTLNATTLVKSGGTSSQFLKADGSVDSTAYGTGSVTSVGLSSATSGVTIGSTPITTSGTITLAIATASGSQQGLLSSTDWTTFNNKQNALTNPVTGTGTTNYLPKFTGASTIGNSIVQDDGSSVTIGGVLQSFNASPIYLFSTASTSNYEVLAIDKSSTDARIRVYKSGTGSYRNLIFETGGSTRVTLDTSGNLGLGVTPSAWSTANDVKAFQLGSDLVLWRYGTGGPGAIYLGNNYYWNGTNRLYLNTGVATEYVQTSGQHQWLTAPSGTAGNAISFTQAMTLNASGNLSIGNTNDTYKLDVTGEARFTGQIYATIYNATNTSGYLLRENSGSGYGIFKNSTTEIGIAVNGNVALNFASTGAATFTTSSTNCSISINNTSNTPYIRFDESGTSKFFIGQRNSVSGDGGTGYDLLTVAGNDLRFFAGNTKALTLAATGAATFTSSVTANNIFKASQFSTGGFFQSFDGANEQIFGSWKSIVGSGNSYDSLIYSSNASSGFYVMTGGSTTPKLTIASTGAATFSSTLGINGVSDNIKSGTYTPTLSSIYNVASSTAFVCQYMRVGNVVTVSGVINVTATATNTWTRISMTLPISSNFDFSYRAGGGGGANSTNNVCVILAGASTSVVYLDAYPNSTNSLSYYFSYTYQII